MIGLVLFISLVILKAGEKDDKRIRKQIWNNFWICIYPSLDTYFLGDKGIEYYIDHLYCADQICEQDLAYYWNMRFSFQCQHHLAPPLLATSRDGDWPDTLPSANFSLWILISLTMLITSGWENFPFVESKNSWCFMGQLSRFSYSNACITISRRSRSLTNLASAVWPSSYSYEKDFFLSI